MISSRSIGNLLRMANIDTGLRDVRDICWNSGINNVGSTDSLVRGRELDSIILRLSSIAVWR